jgi:CHAT domain-containing protein
VRLVQDDAARGLQRFNPTVDLTTAMFAAQACDSGIGKAEALRRAQNALRSRPQTAHPFFWAPFVVVGDGGAPQ